MLEITDELVEKCAAVAKEVGKCSHIDWSRLARAVLTAAQQQGEASKSLLAGTLSENEKLWAERGETLMPNWFKNTPEGQRAAAEFEGMKARLAAAEKALADIDRCRNANDLMGMLKALDVALAAYPPKPASGTELGQRGGE